MQIPVEKYADSYSISLCNSWSDGATLDDYAIACALAEQSMTQPQQAKADTSLDHELARKLQADDQALARRLQDDEAEQLRRIVRAAAGAMKKGWDVVVAGRQEAAQEGEDRPSPLSQLDQALRARLSLGGMRKLIPRINSYLAPSQEYVSEDRKRLLLRLDFYALKEKQVQGDGNCQLRALSDQLYRTEERHLEVREKVVQQLRAHPERYQPYVPMDYEEYCSMMAKPGNWGDHVTLQAASDAFGVRICIVSSFMEECVISIEPAGPVVLEDRVLWLAFWAEVHYNSIYPKED